MNVKGSVTKCRSRERSPRLSRAPLIVFSVCLFVFGCTRAPVASVPAAVAANATPPLTRYISDDAALVIYVNLERVNSSSYRQFFTNAVGTERLAKVPFLKSCREMYWAAHHPVRGKDYEYSSFLLSGCDERTLKSASSEQEIHAGHDNASPATSELNGRFKALGNGSLGVRTSGIGAAVPDWSEATNPLKFDVHDADIAMRVGSPALRRFAGSVRVPDAQIRILSEIVEMRWLVRLEPQVNLAIDLEFVNDAPAESLVRILPSVIEIVKARVAMRDKGLAQALRNIEIHRTGRVVSLSVTLPRFDAEKWVLEVPAVGERRVANRQ